MPDEERRILSDQEKQKLLDANPNCYICGLPLAGYSPAEIHYDHIYSYAEGHSQDISNFAPVHASREDNRLNCHQSKGRKSPIDYREELRIKNTLTKVAGLSDLCQRALPSEYSISPTRDSITFNGAHLPLYNQRIGLTDNLYFFHEIETSFIENDEKIQLRPLEPKILAMIFNLKSSIQLLPCLARLDEATKKVKLFDGQHKAVAQIIGNNRNRLMCIVFVHPDVNSLRITVYQAHTDFVQQKYKKSHIDAKLADIFGQKIVEYQRRVGNPNAPFSEADILRTESAAEVKKFLLSAIINEVSIQTDFIRRYKAEGKAEQRERPILWQSIEKIVSMLCRLTVVSERSDSDLNFRTDEIDNLVFVLGLIDEYAIRDKWSPNNPQSMAHRMCRTFFYRTAFNTWIVILEQALRHALDQMRGIAHPDKLCYQKSFSPEVRKRFATIVKRLFEHPLWVRDSIQDEIAKTNQDSIVAGIFHRERLDYIYLAKIE